MPGAWAVILTTTAKRRTVLAGTEHGKPKCTIGSLVKILKSLGTASHGTVLVASYEEQTF